MLGTMLKQADFLVEPITTSAESIEQLQSQAYDLVILDLDLPDADGMLWISEVREWSMVPIIALSESQEMRDRVLPLQLGADDLMIKPISLAECRERVRAVLKRAARRPLSEPPERIHRVGSLELDNSLITASYHGQAVRLTPTEFRILRYLVSQAGRDVTRDEIMTRAIGYTVSINGAHVIDVHMGRMRQKLVSIGAGHMLETVRGIGFAICDSE